MNSQAPDPPMVEALEAANSLLLFRLEALIEAMLAAQRHRRPREFAS